MGDFMNPSIDPRGHDPLGIKEKAEAYGKNYLAEKAKKDEEERRKNFLADQANAASGFANQGQAGYGAMTEEAKARREYLKKLASGEISVSREQLRQGLQQNLAGQRSMAAGAAPNNAAMAARTAAMQMGRLGSGLAGQQAVAGLQERQAAEKALADMILQERGQDIQVGLGGRGLAIQGQSQGTVGAPPPPEPSFTDKLLGAALGAIPVVGGMLGKPAPTQSGGALPSGGYGSSWGDSFNKYGNPNPWGG